MVGWQPPAKAPPESAKCDPAEQPLMIGWSTPSRHDAAPPSSEGTKLSPKHLREKVLLLFLVSLSKSEEDFAVVRELIACTPPFCGLGETHPILLKRPCDVPSDVDVNKHSSQQRPVQQGCSADDSGKYLHDAHSGERPSFSAHTQ